MTIRLTALLAAALVAGLSVTTSAMAANAPITIYTDQYAGDEAISRVARDLIEAHYDTPVELKAVSVGVSFIGTTHNKRSMFLAAWLPKTHADYMARVKDKVVTLGTIYNGARLGWAVPSYVPRDQLDSIADLSKPAVADKLNDRIQGISPGAGLMEVSHKALKAYGLDNYRLSNASGAAMTAALKRAIEDKQWIVVTAWSPHWMWQRFNLRYLKDPKSTLGASERVEAIANPHLPKSAPRVTAFIKRLHFSLDQVNAMLADANKTSYDSAAKHFITNHPDLVKSWLGDS
ncbi:MAG: glycine betaine ABC transporter substrate-binding protein [Salinisphaera sp.]|jgi:glycine betaine/proline transport system substrate-binding protein|nr:glycine betaine ABC transporter substrate-binding protein [Salinisphaera sp.]